MQLKALCVSLVAAGAVASLHLNVRTITQIQNDLTVIANKTQQISSTSIFAKANPTTYVFSLAVVNAINATDIAAKTATTDTANTAAFTDAQCTQLLNATEALVPGTLQFALPNLVGAHNALVMSGYWIKAWQTLGLVKTDLHKFIGNLGVKCPTAAGKARATSIQTTTDNMIQNALNTM
ncbi:hypothetical protein BKA62DRAFT_668502 [Auriculariales sp. MPI-PUGE-AT-0066]|nr:hypothetical protein BKA62DRAFT_668502 [Auriculariales sp. MPI-PUGE-AT-0066]